MNLVTGKEMDLLAKLVRRARGEEKPVARDWKITGRKPCSGENKKERPV